jgi:hypothetical protein
LRRAGGTALTFGVGNASALPKSGWQCMLCHVGGGNATCIATSHMAMHCIARGGGGNAGPPFLAMQVLHCHPDFGNASALPPHFGNADALPPPIWQCMHCHPDFGNADALPPPNGNAVPPAPLNLVRLKRRYGENVPRMAFPQIDILHLVGTHITRLPQFLLFWLARLERHYGETFVHAINCD